MTTVKITVAMSDLAVPSAGNVDVIRPRVIHGKIVVGGPSQNRTMHSFSSLLVAITWSTEQELVLLWRFLMFRRRRRRGQGDGSKPVELSAAIYRELRAHVSRVGPADRAAAESAITGLYELSRLSRPDTRGRPRFVWMDSPFAASRALRERSDDLGAVLSKENFLDWEFDERPAMGMDPGDPAFVLVVGHQPSWPLMPKPETFPATARRLELWTTLMRSAGWWWPAERACVVTERPVEVHLETGEDGNDWLHRADGPAIRYRDGNDVYAWHGVVVPERYITGALTGADWRAETNSERRQVIIERMGPEWLLDHTEPERIAADEQATLWRVANSRVDSDERLFLGEFPSGKILDEDLPEDILLLELTPGAARSNRPDARSVRRVPVEHQSLIAAMAWAAENG